MKIFFSPWLKQALVIIAWGTVFYFSGLISLKFDDPDSFISIVWFPSGVAVAAFLCARWRDYPPLFAIFILANILLDQAWNSLDSLLMSSLHAVMSMPANIAIAWAVRRFARINDDLHTILVWITATCLISMLDALIVGGTYAYLANQPVWKIIWYGFSSDATGIFFATTIIMGLIAERGPPVSKILTTRFIGFVLWIALCLVTWFIFGYQLSWLVKHATAVYFALTCLPIVLAMILAVVRGNRGGSLALLTLGIIVIYYTDIHQGPFFIRGINEYESLILALSYLSAAALLVAFIRILRRSINSFDPDTGRVAGNGIIYHLLPASGRLFWDNDLSPLLSPLTATQLSNVEQVLQYVHPQDRDKLHQYWLSAPHIENSSLVFRIQPPGKDWIILIDSGGMVISEDAETVIVGNWQVCNYPFDL